MPTELATPRGHLVFVVGFLAGGTTKMLPKIGCAGLGDEELSASGSITDSHAFAQCNHRTAFVRLVHYACQAENE